MSSALACDRDTVLGAVAGLEAAVDALTGVSFDGLTAPEVVQVLSRLETVSRRQPVVAHRLLGKLVRDGSARDLGAKSVTEVLTTALRISPTDANRRLKDAAELGQHRAHRGTATAAAAARRGRPSCRPDQW
jgi:hypothetical protein